MTDKVDFHGGFWFPVPPAQLWATAGQFGLFQTWWSWLGEFRSDAPGLVEGNVLHGLVVPPVPYRLRLDIVLQRCEPPRLIEAAVDGDVRGPARLRLTEAGEGTLVTVAWSLQMRSAPLRAAALMAYPLLRWGHDRVLDQAVAGFRQRALPQAARVR